MFAFCGMLGKLLVTDPSLPTMVGLAFLVLFVNLLFDVCYLWFAWEILCIRFLLTSWAFGHSKIDFKQPLIYG
jgi:hypothetical protein